MELHPFHREAAVAQPHDLAVLGLRRHGEAGRQALALDDERVGPGGHEIIRNPPEKPPPLAHGARHPAPPRPPPPPLPPKACPIAGCPRHTPRSGTLPASRAMRASVMPASSGVPGPGESTTCDGPSAATSSTAIWSLRNTRTCAPSSPRYCARL